MKIRPAKRHNLEKIILQSVAFAGLLPIAILAPNVLGAMGKLGMLPKSREREFISNSRTRLIKKGLLKYENGFLQLTAAGEKQINRLRLLDYKLKKPKTWDEKWRVLIFDIPEYRKSLRNKIRHTLAALGFVRLQDSVWIYPYDCEDVLTLLKADFKIGKDLLYMVVEFLEHDKAMRARFGLK
jgi:DNA-binding transcriptional regulator PaaX